MRTKSDKFQLLQRVRHVSHEQRIDYDAVLADRPVMVRGSRGEKQMHSWLSCENGTSLIVIYDARETTTRIMSKPTRSRVSSHTF